MIFPDPMTPKERRARMRAIEREILAAIDRKLRFPTDGQLAYYQGLADEYAALEALEYPATPVAVLPPS